MAMMDWYGGYENMMGSIGGNTSGLGVFAGLLVLINIIAVI